MDDDVMLEVSIKRDLKLNDLSLTRNDLERIKECKQGEVKYMDMLFSYETSGGATFYRDSELDYGRDFTYIDFYNEKNKLTISVRIYEDSTEKIMLSQSLRKEQITILSEGK
ncbi:MAG: hypothetical protein HQK51_12705 [Oligoflexia bacterium]|nr:hypothetical protein [Oligoflexia bacterium]